VHVVDSTVAPGDPYSGVATITTPPTDSLAHGTAPTYANFQSPPGLGDSSGEPSIGANFNSGRIMTKAVFDTLQVTFTHTTLRRRDGNLAAQGWPEHKHHYSGIPSSSRIPKPVRTVVSQLFGHHQSLCFYRTTTAKAIPSVRAAASPPVSIIRPSAADRSAFVPPTSCLLLRCPARSWPFVAPSRHIRMLVYYASQDIGDAAMALSQDGGLTYEAAHPMYTVLDCGGLHVTLRLARGIVYLPNKSCGSTQGLIVSMDNGLTFTVQPVIGSTPNSSDPSVGNRLPKDACILATLPEMDIRHITVSDDQGRSWHRDLDVGVPFSIRNAVFPESLPVTTTVRPSLLSWVRPRLAMPQGADTGPTPFNGVWHGYIATTYNGGRTWFTVDATPNDAAQLGVICTQGTTCPSGTRNLLDFNDLTVDKTGRVFAAYTDGCITAACIAKGNNSTASHTRLDNDGLPKPPSSANPPGWVSSRARMQLPEALAIGHRGVVRFSSAPLLPMQVQMEPSFVRVDPLPFAMRA